MKKILLTVLALSSFSASALTCRDVATERDDFAGIAKLLAVIDSADQDAVFDHILAASERLKKEKDNLAKILEYRRIKDILINHCAHNDSLIYNSIVFKLKADVKN